MACKATVVALCIVVVFALASIPHSYGGRVSSAAIDGQGANCSLSDIKITLKTTGAMIEGVKEYQVLVMNYCQCPQSQVFVKCYGLSSVEKVDPNAIKPVDGERCIIGQGGPLTRANPISFKYAWMTPQDFPVLSANAHC